MRSRRVLLAGALALAATVTVPTAAQATHCYGAQLKWTTGSWSRCHGLGFHDAEGKTSTMISVADGFKVTLHFRGTRPDGSPITAPQTYGAGTFITDMQGNSLSQLFVKKA
ncbi:hypothetical protein [Allokutzneria sp. NRRL B-24872]|uniref:hypothetical protein n=1 Tax=Allokutzneria sp. NRRL B-24872 TaxID=1137961 RepID=UPI001177E249|nr:hypothetical protein [Allokutzneria sp. NRRL B-24872]